METKCVFGSMAAVGLSYEQIKDMIPEGIEVACHNSSNSATISGPKEDVAKFVSELKSKKIFAKEVACKLNICIKLNSNFFINDVLKNN